MKRLQGMKKIIRILWFYICIWFIIVYIISSLSSFIPPQNFSFISLFSIGFPYILTAYILCTIIAFLTMRKLSYLMMVALPLGYLNIVTTFAFHREVPWQAKKDTATLRVMTWNAQSFANNLHKKQAAYFAVREEMLKTIQKYDPDVICFQEYKNIENAKKRVSIKKQLDSLGYIYSYCSNDKIQDYPKRPGVYAEIGVAIFSKLPLLDSQRVNINNTDKTENLIYTDVLFNNKPVRIFTAHLESFEIYTDTAKQKFEEDNIYEITYKRRQTAQFHIRETEVKHQQEVEIIRKIINASNEPVIYCGDLNITPTSYNYRLLKGKNLQDAFLTKGSGIGNTFYKIGPTLRIDVCLVDTLFQVQQCMRVKKKLSDHFPVVTDIKWKD